MTGDEKSNSAQPENSLTNLIRLISVLPTTIKKKVLERVVGQDDAVDAIVDQLFFMIKARTARLSGEDPNLLPRLSSFCIVGPTASGKTHVVHSACRAMHLEMITVDCTTLTGSGWKGRDLGKALEPVYHYQQANPGKLCCVLFDEADKMRIQSNTSEPSFCPQASFLTFLESSSLFDISTDNDAAAPAKYINVDYLIPVFAGAFTGIEENIAERLSNADNGFIPVTSERYTDSEGAGLRSKITIDDLVNFGMLSELCGRIGQVINIEALDRKSLEKIICEGEYCLQKQFDRLMPNKCHFTIDELAIQYILDKTEAAPQGVRGLENTLAPSAAKANTLAQENPEVCSIVLSYSAENNDFVLIEEVLDDSVCSLPQEMNEAAAC